MKDTTQGLRRERIWTLLFRPGDPARDAAVGALTRELGVTPVTARLLVNRGYSDPASASAFLAGDGGLWHDPFLMADMEPAVDRVLAAVASGEKIAIYGDYDVDGVTSVTSLYLYLKGLGAEVVYYIPSRAKEGYGMSRLGVDQLAASGVSLIITVDTGITANAEILYAQSLGMDTVVTDHHECHGEIPTCAAVVNPHRPDCPYPFKELAGVGVVFKFICACETVRRDLTGEEALASVSPSFIDLTAIGTIADVMPLCDENRVIVARGLALLDNTQRCGLSALLDAISSGSQKVSASGRKPRRKVNSGLVGYGIAPRINAAGRIAHASQAVELLLAETNERAAELAAELCEINAKRQVEENRIADQAYKMIDARIEEMIAAGQDDRVRRQVLVLDDDDWMQGIVGIVASRITEKYGLPSILISFDGTTRGFASGDDVGKGSGRSVKGLNLVDALAACEDLLVRFGGHELAAGLTVRRADIPAFRERINEYAASHLTDEMTAVRYEVECEVEAGDLTMEQAAELEALEPYGVANQTPTFLLRDATVQRIIPMGGGKHTKLSLWKDGMAFNAVWFNMPASKLPAVVNDSVDAVFNLNINDYQGVRSLQLIVEDLRVSDTFAEGERRDAARFAEVLAGAPFSASEELLPDRDDIARVYTLLRTDARLGYGSFSERSLHRRLNEGAARRICIVKLRLILRILDEMGVCSVNEADAGIFSFSINYDAPKTSVDASPLLCRLRTQQRS